MKSKSLAPTTHKASNRTRLLVIAASVLVVVCAAALIDVLQFGRAFWDFVGFENAAYRISLGQTPHLDFTSPVGPLVPYLLYFAELFFADGHPVIGLYALTWFLLVPPLMILAPRFSSGAQFSLALAILALIALTPYTVDQTLLPNISLFAIYNHTLSALLFLLGLWYVLPKRASDPLLLVYILVCLFFLKLTVAAAALVLLICAVLLRRAPIKTVAFSILGFLAACLLIDVATGIVSAYLRDAAMMANASKDRALGRLVRAGFRSWVPASVCAILLTVAFFQSWGRRTFSVRHLCNTVGDFFRSNGFLIDATVLILMALAVESQNTGGVGLASAAALLFHPSAFTRERYRSLGSSLLGLTLLLPLVDTSVHRTLRNLLRDEAATTDHAFKQLAPGYSVTYQTLEGARLMRELYHHSLPLVNEARKAGFGFDMDPAVTSLAASAAWAEDVVDAANVFRLKGYEHRAKAFASLSFVDPFTRLLGLSPAKGVHLFIHYGRTLSVPTEAAASSYLAPADGVFKPLCENQLLDPETVNGFEGVLRSEFVPLPLNPCWTLYIRKHESNNAG